VKEVAQEYIDQGLQPIPLSKDGDGKGTNITGWDTTAFTAGHFSSDNNIGLNNGLSNIIDGDNDSANAVELAPKFYKQTRMLGTRNKNGEEIISHYIFKGQIPANITRCYPDGTTIAELRPHGNTVVAPSIAKSKLFNNQWCERYWANTATIAKADNILQQFNKLCVASVLKGIIDSNNMEFVKLSACLKRYCNDWSFDERVDFMEIVSDSIKNNKGQSIFNFRKDILPKIKSVEKNWDREESKQAGYKSFATQIGVKDFTAEYARDMFTWIGEVPKEGNKNDRKTIIDFKKMAMSAEAFLRKVVRTYIVPGLICDIGLYIVAGRPKQGKSYLLRHLAYAVQNGLSWLGHLVMQGDVLLLALEDNEDSMNLNIKDMNMQHLKKPTTFVEQCPTLERGFIESIRLWHEQMDNPKLIIVDTFQKIKPMGSQKTNKANAYEVDYYYLSQLHELAKELKVCIIYVHHLSQADKSHSWDKIMGSTGHQGVTDAMYMLEREEGGYKATFKGVGRNIAGFEMDIEWNTNTKEPFTFQYAGDTYQKKTAKHKKDIFMAMVQLAKDEIIDAKPADVYKVLNLVNNKEKNACHKNMQRMRSNAELKDGAKHGTYNLRYGVECYDKFGELKSSPEPWGDGWKMPEMGNKKQEEREQQPKNSPFSKKEVNDLYESVGMEPKYKKDQ